MKNVFVILIMLFLSKVSFCQNPYYTQYSNQTTQMARPVYQISAPQTMNPNYQLPAPNIQVNQVSVWNRAGQWVQRNAPNMVRGYVIGQALGQPVRQYFENRGAYCPPKPIYVPGRFAPAYYVATCAYSAY